MSIKRKLILIGVCIAIILIVFTVNVIRRIRFVDNKKPEIVKVEEDVITRAEAFRLLSYISYDKTRRDSLPFGIKYTEQSMSDWYDTYVNAVWKMGLIEGIINTNPRQALTYGDCKALFDKLILEYPEYQDIYSELSFEFIKGDNGMLIRDFLELYEALIVRLPENNNIIQQKRLFVLGRDISDDGKDRIATDIGLYYYRDSKDYEEFYRQLDQRRASDIDQLEEMPKKESESIHDAKAEGFVEQYVDKGINVYVCGQEIVFITKVSLDRHVLSNVWIKTGDGRLVETFISGLHKSFSAKFPLSTAVEKVVGDITIENQKVVQISVKPDMIKGKVLLAAEDHIEIEGYGKVPLDENYRIYKIYGELSMEPTGSILVGYETTDFVVSGGKISAALIRESIKAENIRVLLKTKEFQSLYHDKIEFTVNTDFTISTKDRETSYAANEVISVKPGDELLTEGRITIKPFSEKGKVQILSVTRSNGNPKYRGIIEIAEGEKGLVIINELPLEEYLYAVIPSEMPTFYGLEALKVQAVCARSYAYKHLMANSLSRYGAHVDDSISYQVYNNIPENEESILSVKDTYGKVILYNNEVINAYYFSTSCGHTTSVEHVWAYGISSPYLTGKLMAVQNPEGEVAGSELISIYEDLSKEDNFRSFITKNDLLTYDSSFQWYRWNVNMDAASIKKVIDNKLKGRYNANPDLILTLVSGNKNSSDAVYESRPIETIGDIQDIFVMKRETGGIITELVITGSKNTIKVKTEYNIRVLLAPTYSTVIRQDSSKVDNLSMLPSAYFVLDRKDENGKLKSITLTGGGYGHGVGMSQNGVKALADSGKKYDEIIPYFYEGTQMGFIYE